MNRLMVSTRNRDKEGKIQRIIDVLKNLPEGATPKVIAHLTGINCNTVKSLLPKIQQVMKKQGIRGFYQLVEKDTHDALFDWSFQNLILSCSLPSYAGTLIRESYSFGLVNFEFSVGADSKKATLHVSTDHPLNLSSLCACSMVFLGLIEKHTGLRPAQSDILISTIEFNQDSSKLRLDGINCITIDSLLEQFKLYQKKQVLRLELKTKVPISAESLIAMLTNCSISLDIIQELAELRKSDEAVIHLLKNNNALLKALLEKVAPSKLK